MTDAIHHRGPDSDGFFEDAFCSLGHRRLSIIDVAGGRQPTRIAIPKPSCMPTNSTGPAR
jgi:asparagine synthetase B (glutamine-hydrolysing)